MFLAIAPRPRIVLYNIFIDRIPWYTYQASKICAHDNTAERITRRSRKKTNYRDNLFLKNSLLNEQYSEASKICAHDNTAERITRRSRKKTNYRDNLFLKNSLLNEQYSEKASKRLSYELSIVIIIYFPCYIPFEICIYSRYCTHVIHCPPAILK